MSNSTISLTQIGGAKEASRRSVGCSALSYGIQAKIPSTLTPTHQGQYPETDDNASNNPSTQNNEVTACSYIYEFCIADCSWYSNSEADKDGDGIVTWKETKLYQMEVDDLVTGKPAGSRIPLVRCFWHCKPPSLDDSDKTINIGYNFGVYISKPQWETD